VDSVAPQRGISGQDHDRLIGTVLEIHTFRHRLGIVRHRDLSHGAALPLPPLQKRIRPRPHHRRLPPTHDGRWFPSHGQPRARGSRKSRWSEILGKRTQYPVVALAQLNRGVEGRPDKRPKISDLRESGSSNKTRTNPFVYRHEVYNPTSEKAGLANLSLAKTATVHCRPSTWRFYRT